jgi:hypothetical protein
MQSLFNFKTVNEKINNKQLLSRDKLKSRLDAILICPIFRFLKGGISNIISFYLISFLEEIEKRGKIKYPPFVLA